jgi:hypothetical protein
LVEKLNKKCLHFWKLDAIWGCRPNNKPVAAVETLQPPSESTMPVDPSLLIDEIATGGATGSEGDNASDEGGASLSVTQPSLPVSDDENDDGDSSQVPTTRRSKSKPRGPGISSQRGRLRLKGGAGDGLKRLLEGSEARKEARDGKRIKVDEERMKLEADVQMHRIESERATAERVAEIQARSNEDSSDSL